MSEDTVENTEEEAEEAKKPDLLSLIKEKPNAPDQAQLDGWKVKYGGIYASGFSEDELYVWRAVSRSEYKQLQIETQKIGQIKEVEGQVNAQMASEEKLVSMCLLWPKKTPEELAADKGGTVPTLLEQILQNSNFMSPQAASFLVVKL